MSKNLVIPTVHMNGTRGVDLIDQISEARYALDLAMRALIKACPNGRDYYPQGNEAIYAAMEQHEVRYKALESVYSELGEMAIKIDMQGV